MKIVFRSICTLCGIVAMAVVAWSVQVQPAMAVEVLFHGADVDATSGADGAVFDHLESRYGAGNVTYMQGDMAAADGSSADGFDLVMISSTLNSGTVRGKYADTSVGLMNWEQALNRQAVGEFNMSEGGATGNDQTEITIVDPTSPLAAGLSGTITVFNSPATTQLGTGPLGGGVNLVASSSDGVNHAIFSADVGDALLGDGSAQSPAIAPGRRVMFFIQDSSFNDLTPDGITLFNASSDWTAAVPEPSSALLGLVGSCGLMLVRRRRKYITSK